MITCSAFVIYVLSFNGESLSSETLKFNPILYLFYKNKVGPGCWEDPWDLAVTWSPVFPVIFRPYCLLCSCEMLIHWELHSWGTMRFCFDSLLYLLDINQICIRTSCSCSFACIMKFYDKCMCILYESSLDYVCSS